MTIHHGKIFLVQIFRARLACTAPRRVRSTGRRAPRAGRREDPGGPDNSGLHERVESLRHLFAASHLQKDVYWRMVGTDPSLYPPIWISSGIRDRFGPTGIGCLGRAASAEPVSFGPPVRQRPPGPSPARETTGLPSPGCCTNERRSTENEPAWRSSTSRARSPRWTQDRAAPRVPDARTVGLRPRCPTPVDRSERPTPNPEAMTDRTTTAPRRGQRTPRQRDVSVSPRDRPVRRERPRTAHSADPRDTLRRFFAPPRPFAKTPAPAGRGVGVHRCCGTSTPTAWPTWRLPLTGRTAQWCVDGGGANSRKGAVQSWESTPTTWTGSSASRTSSRNARSSSVASPLPGNAAFS